MKAPHLGLRNRYVRHAALVLALLSGIAAAAPTRGGDDPLLHWGRASHPLTELPVELGDAPRAALEKWGPWAAEHGYRLELTDDARVLLLVQAKRRPKAELELIEDTVAWFDELLPAPPRREDGSPASPPVPEPAAHRIGPDGSWSWIPHGSLPDVDTVVLVQAKDQTDYESTVDLVAELEPYLVPWTGTGKRASGFVLERPLCSVWREGGADLEEYDPENELVHRLARLLTLRRFGRQPWWLTLGIAWHFEIGIRGDVYCFPYRDGFVARKEHRAWPSMLKRTVKKDAVEMEHLAGWRRGEWDDGQAILAWGVVGHLADRHADALPLLLEDFRVLQNCKGIERRTDGSWSVVVGYEPSPADQVESVRWYLGEEFEAEATKALAKTRRSPRR